MLLPSPTATTPPEAPVTPPSTKPPSVKQRCQMKAPVDGFKAFREPEQVPVLSPPTYRVVPSNAADAISPCPVGGLPPPIAIRVLQTGPDGECAALERVEGAVLIDQTDKRLRLPSDDAVEERRCRAEVAVV